MTGARIAWVLTLAAALARPAGGQDIGTIPLRLGDAVRQATERRAEIDAARGRVRAGEARPVLVSALEEPMLSPSLDHIPFMGGGADVSLGIEQRFPLSGIRGHRRASALADLDRLRADSVTVGLDVAQEAADAFLMLQERRRTADVLSQQLAFARDVVTAANARYASGTAPQADVLRAEVEVARFAAASQAIAGEIRAAEAMLNASLARDADTPVPPLAPVSVAEPLAPASAIERALAARPELVAGRADIVRAEADVLVMRDMFKPMATVRTGPAYTMAEGRGWMAMVGLSLPIWRSKLRAGVAEAEGMRAMSEADLRAMNRMIQGQAATAANRVQAARARQSALRDDVLPRARMAIDPAVSGYASGRLPLVSVIESVQALWNVETDLIAADTDLGVAMVRLGRAIGSYEAVLK